jgi:hypothetical protein
MRIVRLTNLVHGAKELVTELEAAIDAASNVEDEAPAVVESRVKALVADLAVKVGLIEKAAEG